MYVEYEGLWVVGGTWLFTLAYMYWIWEDSQRHKVRAWPWLILVLLAGDPFSTFVGEIHSLGDPFSTYISNFYRYELLPSRGIHPYLVPLFKYDPSQFVEPIWVLDFIFFWNLALSIVDGTVTYAVMYWIYKDCKRSGERAAPWLCVSRFIQNPPFPINYFIPLSGYTGQIFLLVAYILRKLGYI